MSIGSGYKLQCEYVLGITRNSDDSVHGVGTGYRPINISRDRNRPKTEKIQIGQEFPGSRKKQTNIVHYYLKNYQNKFPRKN